MKSEKIILVQIHLQLFFKMKKQKFDNKARLGKVSNKEWLEATESVKRLITWRLFGSKQCSGAHSESILGMPAEDYYVGEAI